MYRNGDIIQYAQSDEEWKYYYKNNIGAWCLYENDPEKGILYNIHAVNDKRGLAPTGWHIPTEYEWERIIKGNDYSRLLNSHGGSRKSNGKFHKFGKLSYFWISEDKNRNNNIAFNLRDNEFTHEGDIIKNSGEGYSVRCVKD
jgi:hypothetical protein